MFDLSLSGTFAGMKDDAPRRVSKRWIEKVAGIAISLFGWFHQEFAVVARPLWREFVQEIEED